MAARGIQRGARDTLGLLPRTALIVGAGIGGLSAGIALRKAGWNIRVFERAASPRELGFGLLLAPNAVAALRELGVADVVLARGFTAQRGRFELRRPDGAVLKRLEIEPAAMLGGPMVVALRPALHGALLEAVGPNAIALESEAAGYEEDGERVVLRMTNGVRAEGDLLVGADGMGSIVRRALHPDEGPPRSSRIVAVRGAVHGRVRHLGDLGAVYYLGPGLEAFAVRASGTGIYWALSLNEQLVPRGVRDPAAIRDHMLPRMDATFRAITADSEEMRVDELFDRDPLPFWGTGVVTLLGDAAHPVLPHTGQGAAQAIVDAVALGRALDGDVDIPVALRAYEEARRAKTSILLGQGRRTAAMMRTLNPLACAARELAIRLAPAKPIIKVLATINRRAGTDIS